jgi:hypothetical protein
MSSVSRYHLSAPPCGFDNDIGGSGHPVQDAAAFFLDCNGPLRSVLACQTGSPDQEQARGPISMEQLIARIVSNVGIDAGLASKAIGMLLGFIQKEGPPDAVGQLLGSLPGAQEAIAASAGGGGGGLLGGMMNMMGGGGIMGVGAQMMAAGLSMGQVQGLTKEMVGFARENGQGAALEQIAAGIPGMSQFL